MLCAFSLCIRMEDSHCVLPLSSWFGVRSRRVEALQSVGIWASCFQCPGSNICFRSAWPGGPALSQCCPALGPQCASWIEGGGKRAIHSGEQVQACGQGGWVIHVGGSPSRPPQAPLPEGCPHDCRLGSQVSLMGREEQLPQKGE